MKVLARGSSTGGGAGRIALINGTRKEGLGIGGGMLPSMGAQSLGALDLHYITSLKKTFMVPYGWINLISMTSWFWICNKSLLAARPERDLAL